MPGFLDPIIATAAAAIIGIGPATPAAAPQEPAPPVCVYSSSTQPAAAAEATELGDKIRTLVADLNATADTADPRPAQVTEMLERLDWQNGAHCRSTGDAERGRRQPSIDTAFPTTGLAATIINALSAMGIMDVPLASQPNGDDEQGDGGSDDRGSDQQGDGGSDDRGSDQQGDGGSDDRGTPGRRVLPSPLADPPIVEPLPAPRDSPAAAVEQLIRDLASTLKSSSDPAIRGLADDLLGIVRDGPGGVAPRGGGGTTSSVLPSAAAELFTDDFEGGDLGKWGSCQGAGVNGDCAGLTVSDGMGVGQDPERGMVAQFKITDGETAEMGGERSEVRDDDPEMVTREGDDRWYSWSMKFPADFPEPDGGYYIVMQWHQSADSGSPPLALDITQGSIDIGGDGVDAPRQTIGPIRRGEWVDYVLHAGFSSSDGFVEAWENGTQTVPKTTRPTMTDAENYIKMGLYRDEGSSGDAEVWFDNFAIHDGAGAGGGRAAPGPAPIDPPRGNDQDANSERREPRDRSVTTDLRPRPKETRDAPASPPEDEGGVFGLFT